MWKGVFSFMIYERNSKKEFVGGKEDMDLINRKKLIIDTDCGSDDAMAIAMARANARGRGLRVLFIGISLLFFRSVFFCG